MNEEAYRKAFSDLIYLSSCAVNQKVPQPARLQALNLDDLYQVAKEHLLSGVTAFALEQAGIRDHRFTQARGKAVRKAAAFDLEMKAVLSEFEKAGIWYLPLKGVVLKGEYPMLGMRQMSDVDILSDVDKTQEICEIMQRMGYQFAHGGGAHDSYFKQPIFNCEIHHVLFLEQPFADLYRYYSNIKEKLQKDEENQYGYHFRDEDFYLYMVAHEYKHFSGAGTGLRSLLDCYIYLKNKGESLDWSYLSEELKAMGMTDFEQRNRTLAMKLFGGEDETLFQDDQELLERFFTSGAYGSIQNQVRNQVEKYGGGKVGRMKYLFGRIFLPLDTVRMAFPTFAKYPFLLPFLPFYRLLPGWSKRRKRILHELKTLVRDKKK